MSDAEDSDEPTPRDKVFVEIIRPITSESQQWAEPLVSRLASEAWRLRRRLARIEGWASDERLRPLRDSISRMDDVFLEYGITLVEHDGQRYDPGLQVEVLHARDGEGEAVVVETIRPTVILDKRILQQGQVVIGPADESEPV